MTPQLTHSRLVPFMATAATFLLIGIASAFYFERSQYHKQLGDPDFLQKQLAQVSADSKVPRRGGRPLTKIRIATATAGELVPSHTFHGKLVEVRKTILSAEVTGVVAELPVEVGTAIEGGQTRIAQIDNTWTELAIAAAKQEIELNRIKMEFEKRELEKLRSLLRSSAISESEFQTQLNKVEQLTTLLEKARVALDEATEKRKRTDITAPFTGHIVAKMTEVGALVSPGTPMVQIVSSGEIDAVVQVVETVIDHIRLGDRVSVRIDSLELDVEGTVHAIVPYSDNGPRFPVHIRMPDLNGRLKVGMSVTAFVPAGAVKPGILVPKDAVLDRPGEKTVWVTVASQVPSTVTPSPPSQPQVTVQPIPIRILANGIEIYSVVSDTEDGMKLLVDGAQVVIEGAERLAPGQVVQIIPLDPAMMENLPSGSGHSVIRK